MKKNALNKIIAAVVVIGVIGGIAYYGVSQKNATTKKAKVNTVASGTSSQEQATTQQANKPSPQEIQEQQNAALIKQMQQGHWAANKELGYINPIYDGYNPGLILQNENIIKSAQSYAVPANEVAKMIDGTYKGTEKEVFLTFDDGPSPNNTPKILNILNENGVHATFFVIGSFLKSNPALQKVVRQELMDGNAIGDHTFNHEYSELYPNNQVNVQEYMKQDNETATLLKDLLGPDFNTRILRMPGGYMSRKYYKDPNLTALNEAFDKEHITALDWNAETGDAETSGQLDVNKLLSEMKQQIQGENQVVLLMHDAGAKVDTVTALPAVIKYFKDNGYAFKVIENAPASSFNNIPVVTNSNSNQE